jgi:ADP-ribose pyrophosphatase YjhB (NUDIX family)
MSDFDELFYLPIERRWRERKQPVPGVLALIRRTNHYLLIRRLSEPYKGKWALVGGHWDFGETLASATCREVQEETGLETGFVALRGVSSTRVAPGDDDSFGAHYLLFICELSAPVGEASEQAEGPVAWFTAAEIHALNADEAIAPTDYEILRRFANTDSPLTFIEAGVVSDQSADTLITFDEIAPPDD